jgi:hypothetical protein
MPTVKYGFGATDFLNNFVVQDLKYENHGNRKLN